MNRDVEFERLRQENLILRQSLAVKDEQIKVLKHENHSLQDARHPRLSRQSKRYERVSKRWKISRPKTATTAIFPPLLIDLASTSRRACVNRAARSQAGKLATRAITYSPLRSLMRILIYRAQECQHCHQPLDMLPAEMAERRQVIDFSAKRALR